MTHKTATFVKRIDGTGDGRVFRLDPPLIVKDYDGEEKDRYDHVWVSAVVAYGTGPETYIFGCDAEGEVLDWLELDGSFRGSLDHAEALRGAGYEIAAEVTA